jgi:dienelactone hydrolase
VRPLDAEGTLVYLKGRHDVAPSRVFLLGWSNGARTTLNVMIRQGKAGKAFAPLPRRKAASHT